MAQWQVPGGPYVEEVATFTWMVPGSPEINETAPRTHDVMFVFQAVNRGSTY